MCRIERKYGDGFELSQHEYIEKLEAENKQLKAELRFFRSLADAGLSGPNTSEVFLAEYQSVLLEDVKKDIGRIRRWLSASRHT